MKYNISLEEINSIDVIADKWSRQDYLNLLELFEYGEAMEIKDDEILDLLKLVIADTDPQQAAAIVLSYKLGEELNTGQIEQLSNDMLKENVAEHYSDISFHSRLFDINVFLYKAYNGKFPHARASVIKLKIVPVKENVEHIDEALILRATAQLIDDHAIFKRLYINQLTGDKTFEEASDIIWYMKSLGEDLYEVITSDYWINESSFMTSTATVEIKFDE
jgi:hypothetical protein